MFEMKLLALICVTKLIYFSTSDASRNVQGAVKVRKRAQVYLPSRHCLRIQRYITEIFKLSAGYRAVYSGTRIILSLMTDGRIWWGFENPADNLSRQ